MIIASSEDILSDMDGIVKKNRAKKHETIREIERSRKAMGAYSEKVMEAYGNAQLIVCSGEDLILYPE